MGATIKRTNCIECNSKNNLCWFYSDTGILKSKCMTPQCKGNNNKEQYNESKRTEMDKELITSKIISNELITNGVYENLEDRKISEEICRKYLMQTSNINGKKVHIYNYTNKNGDIISQKIRFLDNKSFIWRQNSNDKQLFGQGRIISGINGALLKGSTKNECFITEGELDCLSLAEIGIINTVSISTGAGDQTESEIKRHLEFLEQFEKVILVFDNDKVGQETQIKIAKLFTPGKCYITKLRYKDPNEYLQKGKQLELLEDLNNYQLYEPDYLENQTLINISKKDSPRLSLSLPILNKYLRGINTEEGELWLLGAGAKIGKTTICKQVFIKNLIDKHSKLNIGVCSAEESAKKFVQGLVALDNNMLLYKFKENPELVSEERLQYTYNKYIKSNRIKVVDISKMTLDSNEIINAIKFLVLGNKCKLIILDPIHMFIYDMDSKSGERKDIEKFLKRLTLLTKQLKFTILCVCHLSRADMGKDYCEGRKVTMRDFKGTAAFEQLCDVMISVERNMVDEGEKNKIKLSVLANRITGLSGYVDELYYNESTGQLNSLNDLFTLER